jgi:hypothetical protein
VYAFLLAQDELNNHALSAKREIPGGAPFLFLGYQYFQIHGT